MPYYADGSPYFYAGGSFAKHSSLMTGVNRYFHPIAAKYSPNLSTISEKPIIVRRRHIPSISTTSSSIASIARPHRIIDTADIDVSRPPRREHLAQESRPHRLRRDRPTIKIRSQALKDNPALREYNEKHEKTVGELLVEKFMIKDKQYDEGERKLRLYHQASLISNDACTDPSLIDKEEENEILSAIRHRITRRMTRRRSSADVIPLDPEQIKREVALQAAQAEALDSLVAEEQAEIEVEVRRGTFAKRQAMRLPLEISEISGSDNDIDEDDRKDHKSKKHATKKKKRKKIDDKPLPELLPFNDVGDGNLIGVEIPKNVIEEEFEWDDREKCDDIREITSLKDELVEKGVNIDENKLIENTPEIAVEHKIKGDEELSIKPKGNNIKNKIVEEKGVDIQIDHEKLSLTAKRDRVEKNKNVPLEKKHENVLAKIENKLQVEGNMANELKKSDSSRPIKKNITSVKEEVKPKVKHFKKFDTQDKLSITDQKGAELEPEKEESDTFPGFKVEACNSVGDFSTLYVKAANSPSETIRTIEQFRESIRLPAPKRPELSAIETEVVLPVRKPYIRDTSRNSAYLALKPSQFNNNNIYSEGVGPDDGSSIIIDTTRKESSGNSVATLIDSRPANSIVIDVEHQSKMASDLIVSEEGDVSAISYDTVSHSPRIEERRDDELEIVDIKLEPTTPSAVNEKIGCSALRGGEEFISWWDESDDTSGSKIKEKSVDSAVNVNSEKKVQSIISDNSVVTNEKFFNVLVPEKKDLEKKRVESESQFVEKKKIVIKSDVQPVTSEKSVSGIEKEAVKLEKEAEKPEKKVAKLEKELVKSEIKVSGVEQKAVKPGKKVSEFEEEEVKFETKASELEKGAIESEKQVTEIEKEAIKLETKVFKLESEPVKSEKKVFEVEKKVVEPEKKISELEKVVVQLETKVSELEKEAITSEKKVSEIEKETIELEKKVPKLEKELVQSENEVLKLEKEAVDPGGNKLELEKEAVKLEKKVAELEKESVKLPKKKSKLKTETVKLEPIVGREEKSAEPGTKIKRIQNIKNAENEVDKSSTSIIQDQIVEGEKILRNNLEIVEKSNDLSESINEQKKGETSPKALNENKKQKITGLEKEVTAQIITHPIAEEEKSESKSIQKISSTEKKVAKKDHIKSRHELLKTDHPLPKIPEEPKSASPTEKKSLSPIYKSKESSDKSPSTKEEAHFSVVEKAEQPLIKSELAGQHTVAVIVKKEKGERKKKVDAAAVMKIEKKILEDLESPCKILTTAIPETQIAEVPTCVPVKKEEAKKLLLQQQSLPDAEKKVGLLTTTTKKKSKETLAAAKHAAPEIDFWSEIKAQESMKVSGTPKKVQSRSVSPAVEQTTIEQPAEVPRQSTEKVDLRLNLSKIKSVSEDEDSLKTPIVPEQEDQNTPLISDPSTPLIENLNEVPLANLQLTSEDRELSVVQNGFSADQHICEKEEPLELTNEIERSSTIKKISKWTKHDNLADLNDVDQDVIPVTSKEASPQVSAASSTITKKKVVKKKKTSTTGTKKKSEKGESTKSGTKTGTKTKVTSKKATASPQTSLLKAPMSASGRISPSQRPPELNKLFYTTPAILLTATPRDLRKVRRAKVKRKKPPTRTPSFSSDSTGSTRSTATTSTSDGSNCEEDAEQKRLASTRSNDSGFDGSPRLSTPSQSSENQRNAEGEHFHPSGRITPPATNLPRFKKYEVTDFNFLKVLGKGSFGKVLLAELRGTECVYAVKCLKKDVVLEDDDVECTLIERKVLTLATRHPYLCHLFCTFQTESHLFFVMEYLNGGDLMFHIQKSGRFSEARAKFYAAEIWSGLIFLHKKGIVYRDLKLDNVLLDFEGHIRIADFGMCKLQIFLDRTADTFCGTPDYMAPEIIKGLKYNQAVDWWSFGVLLYEMLTGQSPFSGCDEDELFWSICNERPFIPRYLGQSATDIIVCLLEKDSGKRIPGHEIACHPFFCTISWEKLERRQLEPPFKPAVEHTLDTRYFDTAFTAERPRLTPVPEQILTSMDQAVFRGFSYTNPNATD